MEPSNFVEIVRSHATNSPDRPRYTFIPDGGGADESLSDLALDRRARSIAAALQNHIPRGARVLMLYPPGLDFIEAFFGCLFAGVTAVPVYPPNPLRLDRTVPRLAAIATDSQPAVVATTEAILGARQSLFEASPELKRLTWIATDSVSDDDSSEWIEPVIHRDETALLQYTSGSTAAPKGVMITHRNLIANSRLIQNAFKGVERDVRVTWLPPYHDMGLIGAILQPLYGGGSTALMSPMEFLKHPVRWLEAISRLRATTAGGPNFGYELCVRKVRDDAKKDLDLSSWSLAFCGAEPVRADTLDRFTEAFAQCGFRSKSFYPCYGLAEATLAVSGGLRDSKPVVLNLDSDKLAVGTVARVGDDTSSFARVVGCGQVKPEHSIDIVDPETCERAGPTEVGEVWLRGPSVAKGYWGRPNESDDVFGAQIRRESEGPYLRTGDLGFLANGELFVVGRCKDVIVARGRTLHPQDIERTVENCAPSLQPGGGAAFPIDLNDEEVLVVVHSVRSDDSMDYESMLGSIREHVTQEHGVSPSSIVLIRAGALPKTSSGKVQRRVCKQAFLEGTLEIIAQWSVRPGHRDQTPAGTNV